MKRFLVVGLSCLVLVGLVGFSPKVAHASGHPSSVLFGVAAVSEDNVWAVGQFVTSSGDLQALIEHWNGRTWSTVSVPVPAGAVDSQLSSITVISARNIWAAGSFVPQGPGSTQTLIEHWNGSTWQIVPSPSPAGALSSFFNGIAAASRNDIWADGITEDSGGVVHTLIEHWDGSVWQIVPSPDGGPQSNFLNGITAISRDDAWAVGDFFDSNNMEQVLFEHWNGSIWEMVPITGPVNGTLNGVAATSEDNAWAVGNLVNSNGFGPPLIEHWDGSIWQVTSTPIVVGVRQGSLSGVTVVSARDAWAVGDIVNSNGEQTLVEHWNGTNWAVVPSPGPVPSSQTAASLLAVSAVPHDEDVWAVGSSSVGDASEPLIEAWNGSVWRIVPSPTF